MLQAVDLLQLLALTVHTLAFIVALGYYGILARVVLPAMGRTLDGPRLADALLAIDGRSMPLLLIAVVLFVATGSLLLVTDPSYQGLGAIRSTWATLMLLKHILVAILVALGVAVHLLVGSVADATDDTSRASALRRLRLSAEAATGVGALTVLLTVAAQLSD
jgi:uncharacterized membrane protein